MPVDTDVDFGFGLCPDVVLARLVRIVGFVGFFLLLLQALVLLVGVEFVPSVVVGLDCGTVPDKVGFFLFIGLLLLLLAVL